MLGISFTAGVKISELVESYQPQSQRPRDEASLCLQIGSDSRSKSRGLGSQYNAGLRA